MHLDGITLSKSLTFDHSYTTPGLSSGSDLPAGTSTSKTGGGSSGTDLQVDSPTSGKVLSMLSYVHVCGMNLSRIFRLLISHPKNP